MTKVAATGTAPVAIVPELFGGEDGRRRLRALMGSLWRASRMPWVRQARQFFREKLPLARGVPTPDVNAVFRPSHIGGSAHVPKRGAADPARADRDLTTGTGLI